MNKGYTLIELLVTIAILSLLVLLAIPSAINIFKNSKTGTFETEVQNIIRAAKQGYAVSLAEGNVTDTLYEYTNGEVNISGNISFSIAGKKPQYGRINITKLGEVNLVLYKDNLCATKEYYSDKIKIEESNLDDCMGIKTITPESCFTFNSDTGTITNYKDLCPKDVIIPSVINYVDVVKIENQAFRGKQLSSVVIPNSVKTIGFNAFAYNLLTEINIPDSVIFIDTQAFAHNQLTSVTLPLNANFGNSVFGMNLITDVEIPYGITTIPEYIFQSNFITSINIPDSVTKIERGAFLNNAITSLNIPDSVTTIEFAAFKFNFLGEVVIPDSITILGDSVFSDNLLTSVTISNNLDTIGGWAFCNNKLGSVTIPDNITTIKDAAFRNNLLTSVFIPNNVTFLGYESFGYNFITQGNAIINNVEGNVEVKSNAFIFNGEDGQTLITPVYLR